MLVLCKKSYISVHESLQKVCASYSLDILALQGGRALLKKLFEVFVYQVIAEDKVFSVAYRNSHNI